MEVTDGGGYAQFLPSLKMFIVIEEVIAAFTP